VLVSVAGAWALVDDVVPSPLLAASLLGSLAGAVALRHRMVATGYRAS